MARDKVVSFRLSEDEYNDLTKKAEHMRCSLSEVIRESIRPYNFTENTTTTTGNMAVRWVYK